MKQITICILSLGALLTSCSNNNEEIKNHKNDTHMNHPTNIIEMNPTYTFLSISTAKPGKLDDLIRIASAPSEEMDEKTEGLLARQVSVDRERNTVAVWVTYDKKETLYDYLNTEEGQNEHADVAEMDSILATFEMYDLTPMSQRLVSKKILEHHKK